VLALTSISSTLTAPNFDNRQRRPETECAADVLNDLKLPREIVREPLFEGLWK
jgi:hypothetical protein